MSKFVDIKKNALLLALVLCVLIVPDALAAGNINAGKNKAIHCQVCHGKGGLSFNPLYPILAGQHAQYIVKQLKAFQSKERTNPIMNEIAAPLSDEDMKDLAAFFNSK